MNEQHSKDYADYFIKDGQLIGRFEEMYAFADGAPWHQDEEEEWIDVRVAMDLLRLVAPFDYIADIGSGLGFFLDTLCRTVGSGDVAGFGLDVSENACRRAQELFPSYEFRAADLAGDCQVLKDWSSALPDSARSVVVCRGLLWCIFPQLESVVANIIAAVRPQQYLLVAQNFPPLDSEFVGKEVIPGPEKLVSLFSQQLALQKSVWLQDHLSRGNDNWWIALLRREQ